MPTTAERSRPCISKSYLEDQLAGLSPVELILRVYDVAIVSCKRGDSRRLSRALVELIGALDFDHREVAVGLFRMYNYCLTNAKKKRFDLVEPLLVELRDTWSQLASGGRSA